jgi:large subunit ribosomal protein L6
MSRVAKKPINIPAGIDVSISNNVITVKGKNATLTHVISEGVEVKKDGDTLTFTKDDKIENANALSGTTRALVNNVIHGLHDGFSRKLLLVGVGYRAAVQGKKLVLSLGFSQPINYTIPEEITVETPSQTEVMIKGVNKQLVGKVAAEIRAFRPPEPYKGKGVRYADEVIIQKEGKKK